MASAAGLATRMSICGQIPSTKIRAMTGPSVHRSPVVRSFQPAQRLGSGPLNTRCKMVSRKIAVISRPEGRNRRRPPRQRQGPFENQKLAHKSIQPGQSERRQQGDAHQSAKNRRRFAQAPKIVQPAPPAAPLLDQPDKIKQGRGRQTVIEHLQHDPVEGGGFIGSRIRRVRRSVAPRQKCPAGSSRRD